MIDFSKLLKDGPKIERPRRYPIKGDRTRLETEGRSSETKEIDLEYEVYANDRGEVWFQLYGGPTGYEGFLITKESLEAICQKGWPACFGTPGSWDSLEITGAQFQQAVEQVRILARNLDRER